MYIYIEKWLAIRIGNTGVAKVEASLPSGAVSGEPHQDPVTGGGEGWWKTVPAVGVAVGELYSWDHNYESGTLV